MLNFLKKKERASFGYQENFIGNVKVFPTI
jgi:hypothetical protein